MCPFERERAPPSWFIWIWRYANWFLTRSRPISACRLMEDVCRDIFYLIGFQNRMLVLTRWAVSFVTRGRSARLITGTRPMPNAGALDSLDTSKFPVADSE